MLFNSFVFVQFFCLVYGLYIVFGRWNGQGLTARKILLLVASYVFYGYWDVRFLLLIAVSTLVDFWCGRQIEDATRQRDRKGPLGFSIVVNLGILGFFKYFNFFIDSLGHALNSAGISVEQLHLSVILPVGISFYTFQTLSYTIDVYRRQIPASRNLLDFAVYVSFFPQLVAGPIERGKHFLPQVQTERQVTAGGVRSGLLLVLLGYFKKVVLADNLAPIVASVFSRPGDVSAVEAWVGIYAFALQIYGDFSGYSDIARGLARMMGFELMLNFRMPYLARTPSNFWKRWHISLSSWLRDYLYVPLGGSRSTRFLTLRNLMLTMLLGGLWHGAAWNFVLWGGFHGLLLIGYQLASKPVEHLQTSRLGRFVLWVGFFHLTCYGWLIFRAESLGDVGRLSAALIRIGPNALWTVSEIAIISIYTGLVLLPILWLWIDQERRGRMETVSEWSRPGRLIFYCALTVGIAILGVTRSEDFIYFRF